MFVESDRTPAVSIRNWIGIVGLIVAPTTVITALCYFFGYHYTREKLEFFGIDSNAIGYTSTDYVIGSVRPLFLPIVVLLSVWAAVLWTAPVVARLVKRRQGSRAVVVVSCAAIVLGILFIVRGINGMTYPRFVVLPSRILTAVAPGVGCALLIAAGWALSAGRMGPADDTWRAAKRASIAVAAMGIVVSLFFVTQIYAISRGEDDAEIRWDELWSLPGVALETDQLLGVPPDIVPISELRSDNLPIRGRLRYECLRALVVRGSLWVLVPARWAPQRGHALILHAGPDDRISISMNRGRDVEASRADPNRRCPEIPAR